MYTHSPKKYVCPICLAVGGIENDATMIRQADVVYKNKSVMAFIGSKFMMSNPAHVIVVPLKHYENVYDLPDKVATEIMKAAKLMAFALKKARKCDGITIQQNNEPAGGQHAFHYHMHIIPRFINDEYGKNNEVLVSNPKDRISYAKKLKKFI